MIKCTATDGFTQSLSRYCRQSIGWPLACGYRIIIDDLDEWMQQQILTVDGYEPELVKVLTTVLQPGDLFFDVGANRGHHTLVAASCGARVHAFEPVPRLAKQLTDNCRLNHLEEVVSVVEAAVSNEAGMAILYLAKRVDDGSHSLVPGVPAQSIDPISVHTITLDQYVQQAKCGIPAVVKIDVEGAESLVLDGAISVLCNPQPPIVVLETADRLADTLGESAKTVLDRFFIRGYRVFRILPGLKGGLHEVKPTNVPGDLANYIAVHAESSRLDTLRALQFDFTAKMVANPLVSIILPTYNGSRYLDEAIQSCLEQTYSNWELVIVDDASTDDTPIRINKWVAQDCRIRSVRHPANRKLPAALNTGFSLARGDYLTWTSDDNHYRPHALNEMVAYLQSHPEVDIAYTDYTVIDTAGTPIRQVQVLPHQELVWKGNCVGPSFLYGRAVQEKLGGYTEDLFLAEDYDFWLRAAVWFRMEPLHRDCYLYRVHDSSLTTLQLDQVRLATVQTVMRNLPQIGWISREEKAHVCLHFGLGLAESGQISEARAPIACAVVQYRILISDPAYTQQRFLYGPTGLRSADALNDLLDLVPNEDPTARAFKKQVWSQYHSTKCFESYRDRERSAVRHHFPRALWHNPSWLRNRGLLRIALWAYTGYDRFIRAKPVDIGLKAQQELRFWKSWVAAHPDPGSETEYYRKFMMAMGDIENPSVFDDKICLDVGCGPMGSMTWLTNARAAIGLDPLVESYRQFGIERHRMLYLGARAEQIPLPTHYVDVVFSMNSLDHVDDFANACAEIRRILKPGGWFIGSLNLDEPPTSTEPWTLTEALLRKHLFAKWHPEYYKIRPKIDSQGYFGPYRYFFEPCPPEMLARRGPKALWCRFRVPLEKPM
jgi:FkbM family methyltransferase